METLQRYPLSVILSFLSETEGTSLLITKKRFAYQLLPIFRLKEGFDGLRIRNAKNRHRFVVSPVQDPTLLLVRLNTRRLFRRKCRPKKGLTTVALASREWNDHSFQYPPQLELLRFLNRQSELHGSGTTLLVSYPRSGNTLVRTLLERTTGVVTGSDTRPDRNLSRELAEQHNLVGEGVTQPSAVAFIKSHWPERTGNAVFEGKRAILLVRNPYDAIDSYWNMNATKSHTKTVTDAVYERFHDKFEALVKNEIQVWLNFLNYWLEETKIPVLVVRFEDLIQDTERELIRMMEFSLEQPSLSSYWQKRVRHVTSGSVEKLGSYQPRSASPGVTFVGKSLRKGRYSNELIQYIHSTTASLPVNYLQKYGYDVFSQDFPNNFAARRQPPIDPPSQRSTVPQTVIMNSGLSIRPLNCQFGRAMQAWRHSVTKDDTEPLPTVRR